MALTVPETIKTTSYTELLVREYFEFFLPEELVEYNIRPEWLKNTFTGRNLELDILYPQLGLAIEVNSIYHKGKYQGFKDEIKGRECNKRKINLLTVNSITYLLSDKAKASLGQFTGRYFGGAIPKELHRKMVRQASIKYNKQARKQVNKKVFSADRWFKGQRKAISYRQVVAKEAEDNLIRMKFKGLIKVNYDKP